MLPHSPKSITIVRFRFRGFGLWSAKSGIPPGCGLVWPHPGRLLHSTPGNPPGWPERCKDGGGDEEELRQHGAGQAAAHQPDNRAAEAGFAQPAFNDVVGHDGELRVYDHPTVISKSAKDTAMGRVRTPAMRTAYASVPIR